MWLPLLQALVHLTHLGLVGVSLRELRHAHLTHLGGLRELTLYPTEEDVAGLSPAQVAARRREWEHLPELPELVELDICMRQSPRLHRESPDRQSPPPQPPGPSDASLTAR